MAENTKPSPAGVTTATTPSVQSMKSLFEKGPSPTSSTSKVAELKARLEKSSPPVTTTSKTVIRTASAGKLTSGSPDDKIPTRSSSASKLVETPKASVVVVVEDERISPVFAEAKTVAAIASSKRAFSEEEEPTVVATSSSAPVEKKATPTIVVEEVPTKKVPSPIVEEFKKTIAVVCVDAGSPEPVKTQSPTSRLKMALAASDLAIPPTVEEQDYYVLWGLSFLVPFFLLRFVFELVRRFILSPARMAVRFAPGGNKLLAWLYVKFGPVVVNFSRTLREKLPPMDAVNAAGRAGLEKFLATLQTAGGAAWPHLLHLAESIKTMKFREAAQETLAVLKAWAPMLLLLIPLAKNTVVAARQGWVMFWRVSKTAVYLPFGSLLRGAVQNLGKTLSENPDVFAERVAGLLGPIVGVLVGSFVLIVVGITVGLVDYEMLSSMYMAWFFRLLGMISEPSLLDQQTAMNAAAMEQIVEVVAAQQAAVPETASPGGPAGWVW